MSQPTPSTSSDANLNAPIAPLRDAEALVAAMSKVHRVLAADLLERTDDAHIAPTVRAAHARDLAAKRTGEGYEEYREAFCDQVAASWVLCSVFVRTLEDRGFVPHRLAGPGAADRLEQFRAQFRFLGERDYLLHIFDAMSIVPGGRGVFGPAHAPLWRLSPSSRALSELLAALRGTDDGVLRFTFGRPADLEREHDGASTRYLGDLYQDLNEGVRNRYALLQTPEFVERFILDQTLDPALRERGIAVTVIDPACGSGHFLIGAYDRLFDARRAAEPGRDRAESARLALSQVHGIDLNPYAAAIARFRLLLSYLDKTGLTRLEQAPEGLDLRVYVGDALLAGARDQTTFGDALADRGTDAGTFDRSALFSLVDAATDDLLSKTRFDVVVANPPYITEKDPVKRELIRERYTAAAGKFALSAPFAERIFQLANEGGFTGQITSNSFMKREFGKALIEDVLKTVDLTEVLDTSGAYIPDHGTPTVILFGRSRSPIRTAIPVTMGNRGEPTTPDDPARGKVWLSIAEHHTEPGFENEYVSVGEIERTKLAQHPWSLGGGGAAELKALIEERAEKRLGAIARSIGFMAITGEDDAFFATESALVRGQITSPWHRDVGTGDVVRDWSIGKDLSTIFPYPEGHLADWNEMPAAVRRWLWPNRRILLNRPDFGGKKYIDVGRTAHEYHQIPLERLRTPLSITFAFVATHNHFVLDRGGKVFKQSAPIIKLPADATEEEHLALLGYLNSSVACFWMKQVSAPKGGSGMGRGIQPDGWMERREFAATGLEECPVVDGYQSLAASADALDALAHRHRSLEPASTIASAIGSDIQHALAEAMLERERLWRSMMAQQEALDWRVYALIGLVGSDVLLPERVEASHVRAFELLMRETAASATWFERHNREAPTMDHVSSHCRAVLEARMTAIRSSREIAMLESPEFKRRWPAFDWSAETTSACETFLLDRAEAALHERPDPRPLSVRALAQILQADPKVRAVAEVLTGSSTFDLEAVLGGLMEREAVSSATCQRYTDVGIEKRRGWERTWELQRREDAGEVVTVPKPEKYDQKDFEQAGTVWRLRGKLDVPKERFIAYPTATPPSGATGKAGDVYGWAGWTHLEQLQAAVELWQEELGLHLHEVIPRATRRELQESLGTEAAHDVALERDAAARERLMPILQTMVDLLPWVRQWHDHDGETASSFEAYLATEARKLEVSLDEAHLYRRSKATPKTKAPKKAKEPKAPKAPKAPKEPKAPKAAKAPRAKKSKP